MTVWVGLVVVVVACVAVSCRGQTHDSTLQTEARGTAVVEAVVEKIRSNCILSEDRLFLRRTAYVMSRDGDDSATYRPGFNGGIWQVTEPMFNATTDCDNDFLRMACSNITAAFNIQWSSVNWSELRKPLYSGLAAALSTLLSLGNATTVPGDVTTMPGDVTGQGALWARVYDRGDQSVFTSKAQLQTSFVCNNKLDLVFILDSSGSVSEKDFRLMLRFASDVVDAMDVSRDGVLVADIVYSSDAYLHFGFNNFTTKEEAKNLLLSTYKWGGGTSTYKGLDLAADVLYDTETGARQDASKVAILITDGWSGFDSTNRSAHAHKELGTTVLAVGVGGYNLLELQAAASDPVCRHVLTLTSFDDIQSILHDIQMSACDAILSTPTEPNVISSRNKTYIKTKVPNNASVVEAVVTCGVLDIYVSTTHQKPGPALYEYKFYATPGKHAILTIPDPLPEGTPLYVNVLGTALSGSAAVNCTADYSWNLRTVPKTDVAEDCDCDDDKLEFENPCTPENLNRSLLRHPHPLDSSKFLICDLQGEVYVVPCPDGRTFNGDTLVCGYTSPPRDTSSLTPLPVGVTNPCTPEAIARGQFYFTYNPDDTKFILCDEWGGAWVMQCAPASLWSQAYYTCIPGGLPPAPGPPVACSPLDLSLPDPCDQHSYYQCLHQQAVRRQCYPSTLVYDTLAGQCTDNAANAEPIHPSCYP